MRSTTAATEVFLQSERLGMAAGSAASTAALATAQLAYPQGFDDGFGDAGRDASTMWTRRRFVFGLGCENGDRERDRLGLAALH